jgi:hypothetical protein
MSAPHAASSAQGGEAAAGRRLLDPEAAVEIPLPLDLALDPLLTLGGPLTDLPGDARLLCPAAC